MENRNDKRNRRNALLGTALLHAVVLVLFMVFGFRTPLPLPAESGIAVNFGFDDTGTGEREPEETGADQQRDNSASPAPSSSPAVSSAQPSATQDVDDAPVITPKSQTKTTREPDKPTETAAEKPAENPRTVDTRALYPGKNKGGAAGGSQGTAGGTGNQGNPDGDKNTTRQGEGGRGGDAGSPDYNLAGRNFIKKPSVSDRSQLAGKIVVYIWVDPDGNVTRCKAGARGTTLMSADLWEKCETAAMQARFSVAENAPAEQQGTLTFIFTLE